LAFLKPVFEYAVDYFMVCPHLALVLSKPIVVLRPAEIVGIIAYDIPTAGMFARFARSIVRSEWLLSQHFQKRSTTAWVWSGVFGSIK